MLQCFGVSQPNRQRAFKLCHKFLNSLVKFEAIGVTREILEKDAFSGRGVRVRIGPIGVVGCGGLGMEGGLGPEGGGGGGRAAPGPKGGGGGGPAAPGPKGGGGGGPANPWPKGGGGGGPLGSCRPLGPL